MLNKLKFLAVMTAFLMLAACTSTFKPISKNEVIRNTVRPSIKGDVEVKLPLKINEEPLRSSPKEGDSNALKGTNILMGNELIMSILTGLLVLVGFAQVMMLINQKRQNQLALLQEYRGRWNAYRRQWAIVIFVGRYEDEFYQVADKELQLELTELVEQNSNSSHAVWALESVNYICNTLSDVCLRILQGQLNIKDVYPLFGSELLRHSRPLRVLLDVYYNSEYFSMLYNESGGCSKLSNHDQVRGELQDWLIYHDGIRRRCLILIDLLWAEATRLEDLSPSDIEFAANAKEESGKKSRARLAKEIRTINYFFPIYRVFKLTTHLKNAEFKKYKWQIGIDRKMLEEREEQWSNMLLRKRETHKKAVDSNLSAAD